MSSPPATIGVSAARTSCGRRAIPRVAAGSGNGSLSRGSAAMVGAPSRAAPVPVGADSASRSVAIATSLSVWSTGGSDARAIPSGPTASAATAGAATAGSGAGAGEEAAGAAQSPQGADSGATWNLSTQADLSATRRLPLLRAAASWLSLQRLRGHWRPGRPAQLRQALAGRAPADGGPSRDLGDGIAEDPTSAPVPGDLPRRGHHPHRRGRDGEVRRVLAGQDARLDRHAGRGPRAGPGLRLTGCAGGWIS